MWCVCVSVGQLWCLPGHRGPGVGDAKLKVRCLLDCLQYFGDWPNGVVTKDVWGKALDKLKGDKLAGLHTVGWRARTTARKVGGEDRGFGFVLVSDPCLVSQETKI